MVIPARALVATGGALKVFALWLAVSYFFQCVGELCISPVGLSSMTKLAPRRFVGQMMGVWFLSLSLGNLIAGLVGGNVDPENLANAEALPVDDDLAGDRGGGARCARRSGPADAREDDVAERRRRPGQYPAYYLTRPRRQRRDRQRRSSGRDVRPPPIP